MDRNTTITSLGALLALVAILPAPAYAASDTTVPIRLVGTEPPVVMVRVQGKELPLQLDLGDSSSLVIHPDVLATLRSEPTGKSLKFLSMDGRFETPIVRLQEIKIGSLTFHGVDARKDTHDEAFLKAKKTMAGAVGFIGTGLFKTGQIRIDYPHRQLAISLPGKAGKVRDLCRGSSAPFVVNQYGFTTPVKTDMGELQLGWDTGAPSILISKSAAGAEQATTDQESTVSEKFVIAGKDYGPQRMEIWSNIPLPPEIAGLIGYPFFRDHAVCLDYPGLKVHIQ